MATAIFHARVAARERRERHGCDGRAVGQARCRRRGCRSRIGSRRPPLSRLRRTARRRWCSHLAAMLRRPTSRRVRRRGRLRRRGAWWRPSGLLAVVVLLGAAAVTGRSGIARSNRRPRLASSGPMSCPAPDPSSSPAPSEKDTSVSLDDLDQAPSSGCACGGPAAAAPASGLHTATTSADWGPACVAASSCVCASTQASQGPAGSRPAGSGTALASPLHGQRTVRPSTARGLR